MLGEATGNLGPDPRGAGHRCGWGEACSARGLQSEGAERRARRGRRRLPSPPRTCSGPSRGCRRVLRPSPHQLSPQQEGPSWLRQRWPPGQWLTSRGTSACHTTRDPCHADGGGGGGGVGINRALSRTPSQPSPGRVSPAPCLQPRVLRQDAAHALTSQQRSPPRPQRRLRGEVPSGRGVSGKLGSDWERARAWET